MKRELIWYPFVVVDPIATSESGWKMLSFMRLANLVDHIGRFNRDRYTSLLGKGIVWCEGAT